jgi:hypothetical protein
MARSLICSSVILLLASGCQRGVSVRNADQRFALVNSVLIEADRLKSNAQAKCLKQQGIKTKSSPEPSVTAPSLHATGTMSEEFLKLPDVEIIRLQRSQQSPADPPQVSAALEQPVQMGSKRYQHGCLEYAEERATAEIPKLDLARSLLLSLNVAIADSARGAQLMELNRSWRKCLSGPVHHDLEVLGGKDPGNLRMMELIQANNVTSDMQTDLATVRKTLKSIDAQFKPLFAESDRCVKALNYQERFDQIREQTVRDALNDEALRPLS